VRVVASLVGLAAVIGISGSAVAAGKPTAGRNNFGAAWSHDSTHIAFVSEGTSPHNYDVWVVAADGSGERDLTPDEVREIEPVWSPDGTRLAFTRAPIPTTASPLVEVMSADGTDRRTLAPGKRPAWSPDGRELAYAGGDGVHTIDVDGSEDKLMATTADPFAGQPAWSPDGSRIAYVDGTNVWVVDANGANRHPLSDFSTASQRLAGGPVWAPNGSAVAFFVGGTFVVPAPYDIWAAAPDGHDLKRLVSFGLIMGGPSWTPDSRSIVFTAAKTRESDLDVYRVALDGSSPLDISNDGGLDEGGTVAPDGTKVAFNIRYGAQRRASDIWTLDLRTRARRNLTGTASGVVVDARTVKAPNRLVIRRVTATVDREHGAKPILRVRVDLQDARLDIVRNAVVTVKPSLRSLSALNPVRRTGTQGITVLSFRAPTRDALPPGSRLTLLVGAHPPGSYSQKVAATKRVAVRL